MKKTRLAIALLGKGSANHLHRKDVVKTFLDNNFALTFLIRDDYRDLIAPLHGCEYTPITTPSHTTSHLRYLRGLFQYIRSLYPADDPAKRFVFNVRNKERSLRAQVFHLTLRQLAKSRSLMTLLVVIEEKLYPKLKVEGITPDTIDVICLIGFGGNEIREAYLARWAAQHRIPTINIVGNYDNLSTKGFRGFTLTHLAVWGESMRTDAETLQAIPKNNIHTVGSLRYNNLESYISLTKKAFLERCNLNPNTPTILFGGGRDEFHYFEMLEVFQLLKKHHKLQLIIRLMPNKLLMQSPEIQQLVQYIKNTEDVFLSIGDQSFLHGDTTQEPLAIEEFELWHSLKYCDLVINLFSTLALEACIFDKPVINMWYFRQPCRMMLRPPVYDPYNLEQHIRRLKRFGATVDVESRDELIRQTFHQLQYPDQRQVNRQRLVNHECGNLDGKAISRLLALCQTCVKQTS